MARLNVNPTRMELKRLKGRLATAKRGHKLLKDKTDEMIRRFIIFVRKNKELREEVEFELGEALKNFVLARAVMSPQMTEEALLMPSKTVKLTTSKNSSFGVKVPKIEIVDSQAFEIYPYSFISVTNEMDTSVETMNKLLIKLIKLAEIEKTSNIMANEIEKNKRRVNALEYVMIPQLEETIKYIRLKLEENERSALVRLMKVKEIISERN